MSDFNNAPLSLRPADVDLTYAARGGRAVRSILGVTVEETRAAAEAVACRAQDADDARLILTALGYATKGGTP